MRGVNFETAIPIDSPPEDFLMSWQSGHRPGEVSAGLLLVENWEALLFLAQPTMPRSWTRC